MPGTIMTQDEIEVFASRLEQFGQTLSPKEQSLLLEILHRASSPGSDDVEGHGALSSAFEAAAMAAAAALGLALPPQTPEITRR